MKVSDLTRLQTILDLVRFQTSHLGDIEIDVETFEGSMYISFYFEFNSLRRYYLIVDLESKDISLLLI